MTTIDPEEARPAPNRPRRSPGRAGRRSLVGLAAARSNLPVVSYAAKLAARAGIFLVIAPVIGPAGQAALVTGSVWSATVLSLMGFGLQVRVLREIVVRRRDAFAVVSGDLRVMAILFVPSLLIYAAAARAVLAAYDPAVSWMVFLAFVALVVADYGSAVLRGLGRYGPEAGIALATSALQMGCVIGAALLFRSVVPVAAGLLLSRSVSAWVSVRAVLRSPEVAASRARGPAPVRDTLAAGLPFFVDLSLSVVLSGIDVMLLTRLATPAALGAYAVGSRFVQLFLVMPWIAVNTMVPVLARHEGTDGFRAKVGQLSLAMLAVAAVAALCVLAGGPLFARLVLRGTFGGIDALWPSFAVLVLAKFFEAMFSTVLTAVGRIRTRVAAQAVAVALIAAVSVPLVPRLGPRAVIFAVTLAYTGLGLHYLAWLGRRDIFDSRWAWLAGAAVAAAAAGAAGTG